MIYSEIIMILSDYFHFLVFSLTYLPFFILSYFIAFFFQFWYFQEWIIYFFYLLQSYCLKEYWSRFLRFSRVFFSWQCIDYHVFFSLLIFQYERNILNFQCLSGLSSICYSDILKVYQIFMISDYYIPFYFFFQISFSLFHCLNHYEYLFFCDYVILFYFVQLM